MWLLDTNSSSIAPIPQMEELIDSDLPEYAILSRPFPSLLSLRK